MKARRTANTLVLGLVLLVMSVATAWTVGRDGRRTEPAPMDELLAKAGAGELEVTWDITKTHNEHVETWIGFLSGRNADRTRLWLERSGMYGPMIQEELRRRGMPQDLLYLALIESGFSPRAYSVASASGIWQFIAETGKRYGLEVNAEVDERRDPVKSTHAALDYLQFLHRRFDSWYLAAAAYNTGENRVGRIMREEFGREKGSDEDFWAIAHRLPRETRNYVPLMLAAAHIGKEPVKYGLGEIEYQAPLAYDEVWVPGAIGVESIAQAAGVPVQEIEDLNTALMRKRTPEGRAWPVRLPAGTRAQFAAAFPAIYRAEQLAKAAPREPQRTAAAATVATATAKAATRQHTVRRGETLGHIATRYGVSVSALRSANGNVQPTRLRVGQTLRVPGGSAVAASRPASSSSSAAARPAATPAATARYHRVQRGENLSVIARRYNTSVTRLQSLNSLGRSSRIIAGKRIRVA
jgi:membrane-bound lytic murein transglycosylase D